MKRPSHKEYIDAARSIYGGPLGRYNIDTDDLEIDAFDNGGEVSQNDEGGAWVKAWVYVRDTDVSGFEDISGQ